MRQVNENLSFKAYLEDTWNTVKFLKRKDKTPVTFGDISTREVNDTSTPLVSRLSRMFNEFPAHLDLSNLNARLRSLKAQFPSSSHDSDLPEQFKMQVNAVIDEMMVKSYQVFLDDKGDFKPRILKVLKEKYPKIDEWITEIGLPKVKEGIVSSYFSNILGGALPITTTEEFNGPVGYYFITMLTQYSDDIIRRAQRVIEKNKSEVIFTEESDIVEALKNPIPSIVPSEHASNVAANAPQQVSAELKLINEIDRFAMTCYEEVWQAYEGVLKHKDYINTIATAFRNKFAGDKNSRELLSTLEPNQKIKENYKRYEDRLLNSDVSDVEILSGAYGLEIARLIGKERSDKRNHSENSYVYDGAMCSYMIFNEAYKLWFDTDEIELPSDSNASINAMREIYRINDKFHTSTNELNYITENNLGYFLLNRIRNLHNWWLQLSSFKEDYIIQASTGHFKNKIIKAYDVTITSVQKQQGKIQQLIYLNKEPQLFRQLTEILNINNSRIQNTDELFEFKKSELIKNQDKLIPVLDKLCTMGPNLKKKTKLQSKLGEFKKLAKNQLTPITEVDKLNTWLKKTKPSFFMALLNSITSFFRKEVMGLEELAWIKVLQNRVKAIRSQYSQQFFETDILRAFKFFKLGRINDIQLLTTLQRIATKYAEKNPEGVVKLKAFCEEFNEKIKQNDILLENFVIKEKKNGTFEDIYNPRSYTIITKELRLANKNSYQQCVTRQLADETDKELRKAVRTIDAWQITLDQSKTECVKDVEESEVYYSSLTK